jgi:hypothetical protein
MTELTRTPEQMQALRQRVITIAGLLTSIVILAGLVFLRPHDHSSHSHDDIPETVISASDLESEYGIRIRLIGVTAAGGMVDFRYRVVDQAKAEQLLGDPDNMPFLIVGDGDRILHMPGDMHGGGAVQERLYFILYPNTQNAVTPGTPISVAFGDFRIESIPAQ